jgi:hypothetical protein
MDQQVKDRGRMIFTQNNEGISIIQMGSAGFKFLPLSSILKFKASLGQLAETLPQNQNIK